MSKSKKLTLCAMLVALSFTLMLISKLIPAPWLQGGNITIASMVPIIAVSLLLGTKWGILSGFVFSLLQLITGFYPPPAQNFISFFLAVMLDYILAFSCLGLAHFFYSVSGKKKWAVGFSGFAVTIIRYICHILSGLVVWGVYAGDNSVLVYSVVYNGTYMIPEIIITTVTLSFLSRWLR